MSASLVVGGLLGAAFGVGIAMSGRAVAGRPAPLALSLRRLDGVGVSVAGRDDGRGRTAWHHGMASRAAMSGVRPRPSDLAVSGRTVERHGLEKLCTAAALAAIPLALSVLVRVGGSPVPPGAVLLAVVAGGAVGFVVPEFTLRSRAAGRRRALRYALSAYLDLVNVLLAGGAGVETALTAAAEAGDGWAFGQLREALVRARTSRSSPWAAFSELGRRLGVSDLAELAASVELAGEQGARIRMSLVAKADALRARQAAEVEAAAQAATERMGLPTVLMFLGFLTLLGYPAAVMVTGGIGG